MTTQKVGQLIIVLHQSDVYSSDMVMSIKIEDIINTDMSLFYFLYQQLNNNVLHFLISYLRTCLSTLSLQSSYTGRSLGGRGENKQINI